MPDVWASGNQHFDADAKAINHLDGSSSTWLSCEYLLEMPHLSVYDGILFKCVSSWHCDFFIELLDAILPASNEVRADGAAQLILRPSLKSASIVLKATVKTIYRARLVERFSTLSSNDLLISLGSSTTSMADWMVPGEFWHTSLFIQTP